MDSTILQHLERPSLVEDALLLTEGRVLKDPNGIQRYLGETSGAAFLDHIKEFFAALVPFADDDALAGLSNPETHFLASLGHYQTHDSRPIRELSPTLGSFYLPSRTDTAIMLTDLRFFAQDGNGDFASGGIHYWGDIDRLVTQRNAAAASNVGSWRIADLALLYAGLALVYHIESSTTLSSDSPLDQPYFLRVRMLLGNPLDSASLGHVPALALLAFFLLQVNRRDSAYMYISLALHILLMHGVHRGWLVDEEGKRVFWTVYVLERHLSALMGRPPLVSDTAICLDMPKDLSGFPSAAGLCANIQLCRISNYLVCDVYRIGPSTGGPTTHASVQTALEMLSSWLQDLPPSLSLQESTMRNDRACCELHMAYNQLVMLTIRPILFVAVKKAVAERIIDGHSDIQQHPQLERIQQCAGAARQTVQLSRCLLALGRRPRLLHAELHYFFTAAVILLLEQLFSDKISELDALDVMNATLVFEAEANSGNSYAQDCVSVLQNLNSLVGRFRAEISIRGRRSVPQSLTNTEETYHSSSASQYVSNPGEGGSYEEMLEWLNVDDLQLFNTDFMRNNDDI